jgi:type VI secretion system secreted protein Hcp
VVLTKVSDSSSAKLFREATSGKDGKNAKIHFVTTSSPGETYIEFALENAMIANYSLNSSGDRPIETIRLNFTKIQMKYIAYDKSNRPLPPIISFYDLATARGG